MLKNKKALLKANLATNLVHKTEIATKETDCG